MRLWTAIFLLAVHGVSFAQKETPIRFGTYASGLDELKITLTAAEIERYGPGIIMDISREGRDRALLWVE